MAILGMARCFGLPPSSQVKRQFRCQFCRQHLTCRQLLAHGFVELELLAHDDLEPAFPVAEYTEHLFIGPACNEWLVNSDRTATYLGL